MKLTYSNLHKTNSYCFKKQKKKKNKENLYFHTIQCFHKFLHNIMKNPIIANSSQRFLLLYESI